jgi:NhaP-type Na+/H+ or K+/H+ antiporter
VLILGIFFAGLLGYGLLSRVLDARSLTPQIVMLVLGLILGVIVAGTPEVEIDTELLHVAGEAALILCLFVDAARIDVRALRGSAGLPTRLLAIGLPLTLVAGTLVALVLFPDLPLLNAVLLAILVAPTDAALGVLVVSSPKVPIRIRQALNVESGLNDGLVTPLVLVAVVAGGAESSGTSGWVADAFAQIGLGVVAGAVVGAGGATLLRLAFQRGWVLDGARWILAPSLAFLAWFVALELGGNAFVAAFVAGFAATATIGRVSDELLEFGEVGGELLGLAVFFMFGVLVPSLGPFDLPTVLFAIAALTIARMLPVAAALFGTRLAPATVAFMGWFGPRGLASIVLALVAIGDGAEGPPAFAPVVIAAVALTVTLSVLAHGLSAGPAVRWYGGTIAHLPSGAPELMPTDAIPVRGRALATSTSTRGVRSSRVGDDDGRSGSG